jgi:hypothetical protein
MKVPIRFIIFSFLLSSCAAVGTVTLYKAKDITQVDKIGFCHFYGDSFVDRICPNTTTIFKKTVFTAFEVYGFNDLMYLQQEISYKNPEVRKIAELCREFDLDGILLSKLRFKRTNYRVYYSPIVRSYDTEVEMKLIDKNGKLLISTIHNTFNGNSYLMPPTVERTIQDGTTGAIKRILKEMGIKKSKKTITNTLLLITDI